MLRELSVQNLALIEDLRVEMRGGYCAWTGETGAGKSLLLTALGLVLGGKASSELVRAGKGEARASAIFDVGDPRLRVELEEILGGTIDDETLILTRRVSASGRGSAQANGVPVTVATLQALGARLIDIHGQNDGRALMEPEHQRGLLDAHGELGTLVAKYRQKRSEHEALRCRRLELIGKREESARERALLQFERDELAGAVPRFGEAEELGREAQRLASAEEVRVAATEGYGSLYEADRSAQGLLEMVARSLGALGGMDPAIAEASETLERLADETREVAYSLREMGKSWEDDPARLELVEERLALYRRLAVRFHCKADDLSAKRVEVEAKLEALERDEADLSRLEGPIREAWGALKWAAEALSAGRRKTAKGFAKAIQAKLKPLGLESARFEAAITTTTLGSDFLATAPAESGVDRVEFVFFGEPWGSAAGAKEGRFGRRDFAGYAGDQDGLGGSGQGADLGI